MRHLTAAAISRTRSDVVMVGPKTFPPSIGGIETHVYEVSMRLAARGYEVTVLVPRTRGAARVERISGVEVVRVPSVPTRYSLKLSSMPFVMKELRRRGEALVHAHDATGGYAASVASDAKRFIYTMHGLGSHRSDWPTPFRQGIGMMQARALRSAAHVFCTDHRTTEVVRRFRAQVEVLSSGVDPKEFDRSALAKPTEYNQGTFVVLWVGRLAKVKGLEVMLEAIRSIDEPHRSSMRFVFIGDGPLRGELQRAARSVKEILYLGQIQHSKISPYVAHADAYVLPSLSEGLPISLLEAMAAGVPAVATDVGGISSQMERDALIMIPPEDHRALAEAIVRLREDAALSKRLGERGRAQVASKFSWEGVVDRIAEVYERISQP